MVCYPCPPHFRSLEDQLAIIQSGLSEDESGFAIPKDDCAHVRPGMLFVLAPLTRFSAKYLPLFTGSLEFGKTTVLQMSQHCLMCTHEKENWSCLACGQVAYIIMLAYYFGLGVIYCSYSSGND